MKKTPRRVLIIDDDPFVGKMTLAHLKAGGHEGYLTDDAAEFMDMCRTWNPDFAIVDLVMEGVDGLEVLRRIADCDCGIRVIIASGQEGRVLDAARRFADANGVSFAGVLAKPYRRSQLLTLLSQEPSTTGLSVSDDPDLPWDDSDFDESFREGLTHGDISVVFQPKVSTWQGTRRPDIHVKDVRNHTP